MQIGTVKQIWRYAVKTMGGEPLESCSVGPRGLSADRGWAIRDETTGEVTNGKYIPLVMQCEARYRESLSDGAIPHVVMRFPDGVALTSDSTDVNARLSESLGGRSRCGLDNPQRISTSTGENQNWRRCLGS